MKRDAIALLLLLLTGASWGGAWVTARAAAHDAPAVWMAVGRFAFAAVALVPVAYLLKRRIRLSHDRRTWMHLAGMALTGAIGYNLFFLLGIELAPASDGAVITPGLSGFCGALFVWLLDGIKPRKYAVYGGVLALVGAALIGLGAYEPGGGTERLLGILFFAMASVIWGIYTAIGRRMSGHIPAVEGVFWAVALATLFWTPVAWATAGPPDADWAPGAFWNMAYLGLIATSVGFVTWYLAVQRMGADRAGPGLGLVPVFGVALAVVFLGERLQWTHLLGGAVVIAGILLSNFDGTLRLRVVRRFERPLDEIWARASDFGNLHLYSDDLSDCSIVAGEPFAVGTVRRNVFAEQQGELAYVDERITAIEGTGYDYEIIGALGPYSRAGATWRFTADGSGTRLDYEATLQTGIMGLLFWGLTKRNLGGGLNRMLDKMGA